MGHEVANELAPRRICTRAIGHVRLEESGEICERVNSDIQS